MSFMAFDSDCFGIGSIIQKFQVGIMRGDKYQYGRTRREKATYYTNMQLNEVN